MSGVYATTNTKGVDSSGSVTIESGGFNVGAVSLDNQKLNLVPIG
jgi:hypothetical protein